jgi:hypothetical protein
MAVAFNLQITYIELAKSAASGLSMLTAKNKMLL